MIFLLRHIPYVLPTWVNHRKNQRTKLSQPYIIVDLSTAKRLIGDLQRPGPVRFLKTTKTCFGTGMGLFNWVKQHQRVRTCSSCSSMIPFLMLKFWRHSWSFHICKTMWSYFSMLLLLIQKYQFMKTILLTSSQFSMNACFCPQSLAGLHISESPPEQSCSISDRAQLWLDPGVIGAKVR